MKESNNRRIIPAAGTRGCPSKLLWGWLCFVCLVLHAWSAGAQCIPAATVFKDGERVDYDLYFKWGMLMPKAGLATLSVKEAVFENDPAWHYRLLFRTSGMMEKVYKMRDTIDCYFSDRSQLLFSSKRTNEGDYYMVDNLKFRYPSTGTAVHSHRYNRKTTKIDTVLRVEGCLFDMLGATMYLRSLDWEKMDYGAEFPFHVAIGRETVRVSFRYTGQQIVDRGAVKFRTRHFYIDIIDEVFTQSRAAAEVWIGDDRNHLPVKIRAKLKIGAAEVYFKEAFNLAYPLDCRVVVVERYDR